MKLTTLRRLANARCMVLALSASSTIFACSASADDDGTTTDTLPSTTTGDEVKVPSDASPSRRDAEGSPSSGDASSGDAEAPSDGAPTTPSTDPYDIAEGNVPYRGINLAGAEFGSAIPGREGSDYNFPTPAMVDYYMTKGMNTFRVGFKWERLQPSANGAFTAAYFGKLDAIVKYATSKGAYVILNPHNFARYYGNLVGSSQVPNGAFADLWKRLGAEYAANPRVLFNLVNEPHDMPTRQWVGAANAAIAAIRGVGAKNVVIAPGNNWTGAHSWFSTSGGASNADAMLDLVDPIDNTLIEVHQYLDANSSGGSGACVSTTIGSERLAQWVGWLRKHGKKGFVGEFAGRNDATCRAAIDDMLSYMHENGDVVTGWLWWAGGPGWGDYVFTLEPKNGQDRPQMAWLTPFITAPM